MAGLPRSFGSDVTDNIMRLAVGYPRDRLRDIASAVQRKVETDTTGYTLIEWIHTDNSRSYDKMLKMLLADRDGTFVALFHLEYLDEQRVKHYNDFCEPCEPIELQLQRACF